MGSSAMFGLRKRNHTSPNTLRTTVAFKVGESRALCLRSATGKEGLCGSRYIAWSGLLLAKIVSRLYLLCSQEDGASHIVTIPPGQDAVVRKRKAYRLQHVDWPRYQRFSIGYVT